LVPDGVVRYIDKRALYRDTAGSAATKHTKGFLVNDANPVGSMPRASRRRE